MGRKYPRKTVDMEIRKIKKLVLCYHILVGFFLTLLGLNTESIIQVSIHINVYNTHTQNVKN